MRCTFSVRYRRNSYYQWASRNNSYKSQCWKAFRIWKRRARWKKIEFLIPPRFAKGHEQHRNKFNKNPHARAMGSGFDLYAKRKDDSEFPVEISLSPYSTLEGKFVVAFLFPLLANFTRLRVNYTHFFHPFEHFSHTFYHENQLFEHFSRTLYHKEDSFEHFSRTFYRMFQKQGYLSVRFHCKSGSFYSWYVNHGNFAETFCEFFLFFGANN